MNLHENILRVKGLMGLLNELGPRGNTDDFIKRAREIHGDRYSYDKVDYITDKKPVIITCPKHGDFEQRPTTHKTGSGCPKCAVEKITHSQDDFIRRAKEIHKDKFGKPLYNYDKVNYVNSNTDVTIYCPKHDREFYLKPSEHVNDKTGCKLCYYERLMLSQDEFIEKAKKIHNNYYSYPNVVYKGSSKQVSITCPEHGDFLQTPFTHLQNKGCRKCSESKAGKKLDNYLSENGFNFIKEKPFEECVSISDIQKRCYELPFDFYLPDLKVLVEIDGDQHFKPIWGEKRLEKNIFTDKLKNDFVRKSSYIDRLIRIYYTGKNVDNVISEFERLINEKSSDKIILSKDYPNEGWNQ